MAFLLDPARISAVIPYAPKIELDADWFNNLSIKKSAYIQLYDHIERILGLSKADAFSLHDRTFVGKSTKKLLDKHQVKYLTKTRGVPKSKIENQLAWSDFGSGPRTSIGRIDIGGTACFYITPEHEWELDDLRHSAVKEEQRYEIKKFKKSANGKSFSSWLVSQAGRPDGPGDIGEMLKKKNVGVLDLSSLADFIIYFDDESYDPNFNSALIQAWREWNQDFPGRSKPGHVCDYCGKKSSDLNDLMTISRHTDNITFVHRHCYDDYNECNSLECSIVIGEAVRLTKGSESLENLDERFEQALEDFGYCPPIYGGNIYFIQSDGDGSVKIGYSKNHPSRRLKNLQTANASKLTLMGFTHGTKQDEKMLHERFSSFSVSGEWFRPDSRMMEYIRDLIKKKDVF